MRVTETGVGRVGNKQLYDDGDKDSDHSDIDGDGNDDGGGNDGDEVDEGDDC